MPESDVAIVMLNHYPPALVERAVSSIRRQTSPLTWTLYLGFHDRSASHRREVRSLLGGLPVHEVAIERDFVLDARARDVVLQEAVRAGRHRWLFFLDDDDEWYPRYLARMTEEGAPFVVCAKDVQDDASGRVETVVDDPDYESMGCAFELWAGRHLPHFAKQGCDKLVLRDLGRTFPGHPVIGEPLYRVHRHSDSLTFRKVLGRSRQREILSAARLVVVGPEDGSSRGADACEAIAASLGTEVVSPDALEASGARARSRPIVIAAGSALERVLSASHSGDGGAVVVGVVEDPSDEEVRLADALLLADASWVDACEAVHARCLPVGIPSRATEAEVARSWRGRSVCRPPRLWIGASSAEEDALADEVVARLPSSWRRASSLADADLCWWPDTAGTGWGAPICRAFEQGLPCVSSSRTAAARILFGASGLLVDERDPASLAERIQWALEQDLSSHVEETLPLFRRAYGSFYWANALAAYLANAFPDLLERTA